MAVSTAFRYVDLFAGIGGFHAMLDHAGGHCVYVSEIDREARETYVRNWVEPLPASQRPVINTDINLATPEDGPVDVPEHDVLAAGFPCQPFSKSGYQRGMDEARGTLFWNIARILEERKPAVVLLENVRNIAGPRHRHEWDVIIQSLRQIGYRVSATPSVFSPHFLPPWRGGTPQVRDRVFILGTYVGPERALAETDVPPTVVRGPLDGWNVHDWDVDWILDDDSSIPNRHRYALTADETAWIDVWDELVQRMWAARGVRLPGFPLWADAWVPEHAWDPLDLEALPRWKSDILIKNARFYDEHRDIIHDWRKANKDFDSFPPSRRKLEWQAQDTLSLWDTVMHFRPSGIRAKAPTYLPALVAITQTSVIGSRRRRITPHEAARLQGLPRSFSFEEQRDQTSYKQVGNGVAVGAAWHVFRTHVERDAPDLPPRLVGAVMGAALNPTKDALSELAFRQKGDDFTAVTEDPPTLQDGANFENAAGTATRSRGSVGKVVVDQIRPEGALTHDIDTTLTEAKKNELLLDALPRATTALYAGQRVVRYRDQVILKAQVTYLGIPWETFKKRIQIPRRWVEVYDQALSDGLTPRFVGIYHYNGVTVFVDFDPHTYVLRKANNSAAHVATNDLYQGQTQGLFSRTDRNGNHLTSVRSDLFADYLRGRIREEHPHVDVFDRFNAEFLSQGRLRALDAVREMHTAQWPDTMQGEWAGFYLEYRLDEFLRRSEAQRLVAFQKVKRRGDLDYDLVFKDGRQVAFYGDLKASNITEHESPGNDAEDIRRCLAEYGRFWYVIYEHETWHSRQEGDLPVIEWNEWRRSVGHVGRKDYDPLSYATRFKSTVRFTKMLILEVNDANFNMVLGDFNQGRQPSGAARALKVMISKRNIDNFLIFSASVGQPHVE